MFAHRSLRVEKGFANGLMASFEGFAQNFIGLALGFCVFLVCKPLGIKTHERPHI